MLAVLGPIQMVVLLAILLVVFGPDKLPEMGKQLGKALRELMKAKQEFMDSINLDDDSDHSRNSNYNSTYNSTDYSPEYKDNYDNNYYGYGESNGGTAQWKPTLPEGDPAQGDFAASAFSDESNGLPNGAPVSNNVPKNGTSAPSGTVARDK
jgi:sec-independent protein translocase protein TatA